MINRLNVEELHVETFDPNAAPAPVADPNDPIQPVVWTGCMSECTECGTIGTIFTIGNDFTGL